MIERRLAQFDIMRSSVRVAALCAVCAMAALMPAVATGTDLPRALIGSWNKQAQAPTANPELVTFAPRSGEIDGAQCTLANVHAIHAKRWYADFHCGPAAASGPVWLDINLLSDDRMMVNRRPLAEADLYVRRMSGSTP